MGRAIAVVGSHGSKHAVVRFQMVLLGLHEGCYAVVGSHVMCHAMVGSHEACHAVVARASAAVRAEGIGCHEGPTRELDEYALGVPREGPTGGLMSMRVG